MRAFGKASEMDMLQDVAPSGGSIHEEAKMLPPSTLQQQVSRGHINVMENGNRITFKGCFCLHNDNNNKKL